MSDRKVLEMRVAGRQSEMPGHPRVKPLTLRTVLFARPSPPHSVAADSTPHEALQLMASQHVPALLVTESGHPIGYFSEREFARSVPAAHTSVQQAMTPCEVSVDITDPVPHCLDLMRHHNLRYIPVADNNDVIALLSREDLLDEMVTYLEEVFRAYELDQQIVFLRGTYSC